MAPESDGGGGSCGAGLGLLLSMLCDQGQSTSNGAPASSGALDRLRAAVGGSLGRNTSTASCELRAESAVITEPILGRVRGSGLAYWAHFSSLLKEGCGGRKTVRTLLAQTLLLFTLYSYTGLKTYCSLRKSRTPLKGRGLRCYASRGASRSRRVRRPLKGGASRTQGWQPKGSPCGASR